MRADGRPEDEPVWKELRVEGNNPPPIVPLQVTGFDERELDRLVADVESAADQNVLWP